MGSLATAKGHVGVPAPLPGAFGRPGSAEGARPGLGRAPECGAGAASAALLSGAEGAP